jgi:hypothetical protein
MPRRGSSKPPAEPVVKPYGCDFMHLICLNLYFKLSLVNIAHYALFIRYKSPTKQGVHLTENIFQTRCSTTKIKFLIHEHICKR